MFNRKIDSDASPRSLSQADVVSSAQPDQARSIEPPVSLKTTVATSAASNASDGCVVIGRGTTIVGQIGDCERLVIMGTVEGTLLANTIVIHEGGIVKGEMQAENAEVHGTFEGGLFVRELLDVRGTGHVEGELSYGKLAVAMGGHIHGKVHSETIAAARANADVPVAAAPTPAAPFAVIDGGASAYGG